MGRAVGIGSTTHDFPVLWERAWGLRRCHLGYAEITALISRRFERLCGSRTAAEAVLDRLISLGAAVP
jgi:hypothetical protein